MSRARYGRYAGGPDPLAAPFDVGAALDELGEDVLAGGSPARALRDLLRRGLEGVRGLDDLMRRARRRQRELRDQHRLDGTLDDVRRLLDTALGQERAALFPDPSDDARAREQQLDDLPDDTARAVHDLADYSWRSPEAAATYQQIRDLLQQQVLDRQFRGLRQALQQPDPEAMQRVRDMLADLNAMLAKDARGEDTTADFAEFMDRHGDLFPDRPESLEELVESLARRQAAADRLMASLSPAQRDELEQLLAQAAADLDLQAQLAQLQDEMRARRPDLFRRGRERMRGDQPLGVGDAVDALEELADLDALAEQLAQDYPGAELADVDEDAVRRALGRQAVDDLQRLQQLERELQRQGYLTRQDGRLELTPKAVRRLARTALRQVFADLELGQRGDHDQRDAGAAGELTGSSREWRFGDEQPLDVVRTVGNALRRDPGQLGRRRVRMAVDDFEVRETERRTSAAVCLLVDLSFSMVLNDTWGEAKRTALALHSLVSTQFPQDALQLVGFSDYARVLRPDELAGLEGERVQGTNLQHALSLAGRFLDRHPEGERIVLVVTDGEPTAHLARDGRAVFDWPPTRETLELTLAEVDRMTRRRARLNVFRLGDDPRLAEFVDEVARRNGGRVFAPDPSRLGEYVVSDFLRQRRAMGSRPAAG